MIAFCLAPPVATYMHEPLRHGIVLPFTLRGAGWIQYNLPVRSEPLEQRQPVRKTVKAVPPAIRRHAEVT